MSSLKKRQRDEEQRQHLEQGVEAVRAMVAACMQCGTCTASCPNAQAMDLTPRQMWRRVHVGLVREVMESHTFKLCSSCYACQLRCPRGLKLTEAVAALKRLAAWQEETAGGTDTAFYRIFLDCVRASGRLQEISLMTRWFLAKHDPKLPLAYTPLGLRMLLKGKLGAHPAKRKGGLEALFSKVDEMEARP